MKGRHTAALAGLALVLVLLWAVWLRHVPGTGERRENAAALLPGLDVAAVTRVSIDAGGPRSVVVRDGARWRLVEPVEDVADDEVVDSILRALAEAQPATRVPRAEIAGGSATTGLGPGAPRIELAGRDATRAVAFGAATPAGLHYAETAPDAPLALVDPALVGTVIRPPDDLREHTLFRFTAGEVGRWQLEPAGAPAIVLERDAGGAWRIVAPIEAAADEAMVGGALSRVLALRAERFHGPDALREPALTLRFFRADASPLLALALGPPLDAAGTRLARVEGRRAVFEVAFTGLLARLAGNAESFRAARHVK